MSLSHAAVTCPSEAVIAAEKAEKAEKAERVLEEEEKEPKKATSVTQEDASDDDRQQDEGSTDNEVGGKRGEEEEDGEHGEADGECPVCAMPSRRRGKLGHVTCRGVVAQCSAHEQSASYDPLLLFSGLFRVFTWPGRR